MVRGVREPRPLPGFDWFLYNCLRTSIVRFLDMSTHRCMIYSYTTYIGLRLAVDKYGMHGASPPPPPLRTTCIRTTFQDSWQCQCIRMSYTTCIYWSTIVGQQIRSVWSNQAPPPPGFDLCTCIRISMSVILFEPPPPPTRWVAYINSKLHCNIPA